MKDHITIDILKYPRLQKYQCCNRVKDIFFQAKIRDFENKKFFVGDLDLCKQCGDNLNKIIGNELNLGDEVIKEFTFETKGVQKVGRNFNVNG